jgi:hypothetical protein
MLPKEHCPCRSLAVLILRVFFRFIACVAATHDQAAWSTTFEDLSTDADPPASINPVCRS